MDISSKIDDFLAILNDKSAGQYAYSAEMGRVNARIVMTPVYNGVPFKSSRSVYCFIRLADGAILKSASWKAPAKGVRAWLDQILSDPSPVTTTSGWLYRCAGWL